MKVSQEILNLVPYRPGKPISEAQREFGLSRVIKLASNENPLGPSPKALEAIEKNLKELHRYPDPTFYDLLSFLETSWGVPRRLLSAGNGSDEIIDILIRIYCEPGDAILTCQAAFSAYEVSAGAHRARVLKVPLKENYRIDLGAMADYVLSRHEREKIRLVFIPNPNNPTGTYATAAEVEAFLKRLSHLEDVLIVFDEAYNEFVRPKDYRSVRDLVTPDGRVVLLKTFSKSCGLAGLRLGVMLGPEDVIDLYNRVRKPFNVNSLAQVAAVAALQDQDYLLASQQLTWEGLQYFETQLSALGLSYIPSAGNFIMFDTFREAQKVFEALLRRGVILRPILNYGFKTHLRMSVGLPEENEIAIRALKEVLDEVPPLFPRREA